MGRFGIFLFLLGLAACGNRTESASASKTNDANSSYAELFETGKLPYTLSDTSLLENKDTTQIRSESLLNFIPDSIAQSLFGRKDRIRYTPMAKFEGKNKEHYYLVKGSRDNKKAALLLATNEKDSFTALLPFLVPDNESATRQHTVLGNNLAITRTILRKLPDDAFQEGKDVFAYSAIGKTFDLVMTDPLDDEGLEFINPIDTLGKTYKFAGDYGKEKNVLVSVRDGRKQGLITIFIHMEKNNGSCTGEIKGDAEITDGNTAIYRPLGDPCVLTLKFGKSSVTVEEQEGCGSKRGLECSFNGTYNKQKMPAAKTVKSK